MSNSYKCALLYTVRGSAFGALRGSPLGRSGGKPIERGLPLPLGEVAERSEDGEGKL